MLKYLAASGMLAVVFTGCEQAGIPQDPSESARAIAIPVKESGHHDSAPGQVRHRLRPVIALHVADRSWMVRKCPPAVCVTPERCTSDPNAERIPCSDYTVNAGDRDFPGDYVYLVVARGDPVAGVKRLVCGLDYFGGPGFGVDPTYVEWRSCPSLETTLTGGDEGPWPSPGGGIEITWPECQTLVNGDDGVHAVAGAFYIYAYSDDRLSITPNWNLPRGPRLSVGDCEGRVRHPTAVATVGIGGYRGFNPCLSRGPRISLR